MNTLYAFTPLRAPDGDALLAVRRLSPREADPLPGRQLLAPDRCDLVFGGLFRRGCLPFKVA